MVKMSVAQNNVADLLFLQSVRCHCEASGIERHAVIDHKTRQMLPRRRGAVFFECTWQQLEFHFFFRGHVLCPPTRLFICWPVIRAAFSDAR